MNNSEDKSSSSPHGKQQQNDSTKAKAKGSNKEVIPKTEEWDRLVGSVS